MYKKTQVKGHSCVFRAYSHCTCIFLTLYTAAYLINLVLIQKRNQPLAIKARLERMPFMCSEGLEIVMQLLMCLIPYRVLNA